MLRIKWHGHACFEIENGFTVVTDPHDGKSIGLPVPNARADVVLISHDHFDHNSPRTVEGKNTHIVDSIDAVRNELLNGTLQGIRYFHDDVDGGKRGDITIYTFTREGVTFCHLGDIGQTLDPETLQKIGAVDVLFVPVGNVFTVNARKAWEIALQIKPKIVVPMHYKISGLSLPLQPIDPFIEEVQKSDVEVVKVGNEIELSGHDELPTAMEVWVFSI